MENIPLKSNRKVRFSLPENNIPVTVTQQKQRMTHGTLQYVNGTLVSQPATPGSSPLAGNDLNRPQQPQIFSRQPKSKDPSTKIVLHLRPSTGVDKIENMDITPRPPGATLEKPVKKGIKMPRSETRTFRTLPQINQKYPSTDDVNTMGSSGRDSCHRHKTSDDLGIGNGTDANNNIQPVRKHTVMLRSISNVSSNGVAKPLSGRPRTKSVGRTGATRAGKPLISSHLQSQESNITIKVQESSPARRALAADNAELEVTRRHSESVDGSDAAANGRPKSQYAKCNFLTVPEFSDRYEGMETVVSASTATGDDEEEEEEEVEGGAEHLAENVINGVESVETVKNDNGRGSKRSGNGNGNAGAIRNDSEPKAPLLLNDTGFKCIQDTNLGRDKNSLQFWDFVDRWRSSRALKKFDSSFLNGSGTGGGNNGSSLNGYANGLDPPVQIGGSGKSDVKSPTLSSRIRALRTSMEQVPTVTTLLRASRDANEYLLKEVFRDILENGISRENLNSTDRSGRTAISYICSTNLTNFLELFLQLPGIDVNKPDNEGNTPLHFAAQAGLSDIVNMLITKCRSLVIDPKNNLGFTPLMKAALQGRTRCAKLLLFAGASPVETDTGRGFRAEQWARFCGRHTCAETIEQCARARLLDKSTPFGKWSHDLPTDKSALKTPRSNSITSQSTTQNGLRSKFRKVFPFNFSSKDKQIAKEVDENYTKDLVNYLKSATICVSGPALSANRKIIQSLIRPLEVPKNTLPD
ncbi:uncharacterized protein LOC129768558 isoform X2 [Toxorhynchites rutilus septentrionalis]|uniref:uncharacterized protein LOC129768558 isoform X2 n=1 Tax=Toxorhynchites rutilus septentrionalis TaxID=329112 RepID=UPI0024794ADF|nr:uncharacterized protein LOC129768558 isoform X2 [Toxorhynchites rutilus septentrionalis]